MLHYQQVKGIQQEKLQRYAAKEAAKRNDEAGAGNSETARDTDRGVDWLSEAARSITSFLAGTGQETGKASSA